MIAQSNLLQFCYFLLRFFDMAKLFFTFVGMRKMIVIFFLFTYVFTSTELSELLKIHFLVEHYFEHQEENEISVSAFFCEHYLCSDDDSDCQLPFHSHEDYDMANFSVPFILPLIPPSFISSQIDRPEQKNFYDAYADPVSTFCVNIWQPPRLV